jgi:hypothetical protein
MIRRIPFGRVAISPVSSDALQCARTLRRQQDAMRPNICFNEWEDCTYIHLAFRCPKVETDSNRSNVWSMWDIALKWLCYTADLIIASTYRVLN